MKSRFAGSRGRGPLVRKAGGQAEPFGAFGGSGSNNVIPVTGFATFYVTGWSQGNGGQQGDPCPGADAVNGGGEIAGHFIKYVDSINTGGGGPACDFNSLGTCVAVLTE